MLGCVRVSASIQLQRLCHYWRKVHSPSVGWTVGQGMGPATVAWLRRLVTTLRAVAPRPSPTTPKTNCRAPGEPSSSMSRKYASSAAAASTIHSKFASAFHWACLARRHGLPAAHRRSVSERPHGNSSRSRLGLQRAVAVAVAVKVVKRKLSARNGWRRMSMSRALLSPMLSGQLAPPVGATYHRVQAVELELELELVCPARHVMERQPCPPARSAEGLVWNFGE